MAGDAGELIVRTTQHPINRWILVSLAVGGPRDYAMVLDTGSPLSSISAGMRDSLAEAGLLEPAGGNWYLLRGPSIDGQSIPDLRVRLSRRVTQVGADGVLGLDFLSQFEEVCFHVASLLLTLRRRRESF